MKPTSSIRGSALALIGGQYGSEGKGVIAAHIAQRYDVHVRVGGPNAGHSFYYGDQLFKMQSVPCGWINPHALLVIGPGGLVDFHQIQTEIDDIRARTGIDVTERLFIDAKATVLDSRHKAEEGGVEGELHTRIGSTGKGVGAARRARLDRDPTQVILAGSPLVLARGLESRIKADTREILQEALDHGDDVLLEGTQGSGLSLIHGPWPYVTSADTNAAQFAVDVGLAPRMVDRTCLVVRTFPIRVAGNSGPLNDETTWAEMSRRIGTPVEEKTTVTLKTRRIGGWDDELFHQAVGLNAPTSIALMFVDYLSPIDTGVTRWNDLSRKTVEFVDRLEKMANAPVLLIGTGGPRWNVVDRGGQL